MSVGLLFYPSFYAIVFVLFYYLISEEEHFKAQLRQKEMERQAELERKKKEDEKRRNGW